jgi:hypothetical protein
VGTPLKVKNEMYERKRITKKMTSWLRAWKNNILHNQQHGVIGGQNISDEVQAFNIVVRNGQGRHMQQYVNRRMKSMHILKVLNETINAIQQSTDAVAFWQLVERVAQDIVSAQQEMQNQPWSDWTRVLFLLAMNKQLLETERRPWTREERQRAYARERQTKGEQDNPQQTRTAEETLGVSKGSTGEVIRKAYLKLALQWHPDKCTQNRCPDETDETSTMCEEEYCTSQFQKIKDAYDRLYKKKT